MRCIQFRVLSSGSDSLEIDSSVYPDLFLVSHTHTPPPVPRRLTINHAFRSNPTDSHPLAATLLDTPTIHTQSCSPHTLTLTHSHTHTCPLTTPTPPRRCTRASPHPHPPPSTVCVYIYISLCVVCVKSMLRGVAHGIIGWSTCHLSPSSLRLLRREQGTHS